MNNLNRTIIGGTDEKANQIKDYFAEKGILAKTVECNPITIQYAAMTDKPEALLVSDKTDYLESLCRCFQFIENPPVLFILSNAKNSTENQILYGLEQFNNVRVMNNADCHTLYTNLIKCINSKSPTVQNVQAVNEGTFQQNLHNCPADENLDEFLHEKITDILDTLDVTPNYNGYNCIREALKIAIQNPVRIPSVSKEIYPGVARILSITSASVERSIRTAIKRSWEKISDHNKLKYFGSYALKDNWSPTNGEYIAIIAEKLKRKYKIQ